MRNVVVLLVVALLHRGAVLPVAAAGTAAASGGDLPYSGILMPEITIGMNTGDVSDSKLRGVEPVLRWTGSRKVGDADFEVRMAVRSRRLLFLRIFLAVVASSFSAIYSLTRETLLPCLMFVCAYFRTKLNYYDDGMMVIF